MMTTNRTMKALALGAATVLWLAAAPAGAQRAEPRGGGSSHGGGSTGQRSPSGGATTSGGSSTQDSGGSQPRDAGSSRGSQGRDNGGARARGDRPGTGRAVPREGPPPPPRGGNDHDGGAQVYSYPWGYGGLGYYGGYYGGYYDPWWWDDPWGYGPGYPAYAARYGDSAVRLDVTPRDAAVFVDGYYAGIVDDFDGFFQRLHMDSGGHRLEIRLEGYETLSVDLYLQPNRTITYHGDLKPAQ